MFLSFYSVRLQLQGLGVDNFGVWSVIYSVISWFTFFDFGVSNGIKNRVAVALVGGSADRDDCLRLEIGTGLALVIMVSGTLALIAVVLLLVGGIELFGFTDVDVEQRIAVWVTVAFFAINLVLSMINQLLYVFQKPSWVVANQLVGSMFVVLLLLIFGRGGTLDLVYVSVSFGAGVALSHLFMWLAFYVERPNLIPKICDVDFVRMKSLLSLGGKFFYLQILVLIIFSSDRVLISHLLGVEDVARYEVVYRYLGILVIFHSLINSPLWPMYSKAFAAGEFAWLRKVFVRLHYLFFVYAVGLTIGVLLGPFVLQVWLGEGEIVVERSLFVYLAVLVLVHIIYSTYSHVSNGTACLSGQMVCGTVGAILNIPLSIWFVSNFNMGVEGIVLASVLSLVIYCLVAPFEFFIKYRGFKNAR